MKKLFTLLTMLIVAITSSWAADDPTLAIGTTAQTSSTFLKVYTDEGITISSDQSYSSGAVQLGNTPSGKTAYNSLYLQIAADAEIEKVSFLISGNGSNKSIQAPLFGWAETPSSNTADTYVLLDAQTVTANSYTAAKWFDYDLSNANVKYVRIYRTTKDISSKDPAYTGSSTGLGSGQTIKIYGIKVWLKSTGPSISASKVNITEDGTNEGEIAFAVDAKGTTGTVTASEEADWLTLGDVDNTNGKVPFTAEANTATSSRSAVVTLTYTYDNDKTATKEVTVTQDGNLKGESLIKATIAAAAATNSDATGTIGGKFSNKLQAAGTGYTGYKFGGENHYVSLTLDGSNTFREGDVINVHITNVADAGKTMQIFDGTGSGKSVVYEKETRGEVGNNFFVLPAEANGKSTLAIIRTNSSDAYKWNAYIDYVEVTRPNTTISLNAKGFATYSMDTDFEFAGATAYKMALNENAKTITGTAVTGKIAAGEGILLKGEAGAKVSIIETTGAEALTGNDLKGTTTASGKATVPTYCYTLSGDTFKKFKGAEFNDNKAYLESTQDLSGQSFEIIFDDQPTAINFVVEDDANVAAAPVKVIKNGQLYIGNYNVAGARIK